MFKFFRAFLITLIAIIVVVYGAFTVLNVYFFAPGTVVNGIDMSFKSIDKASEILDFNDFQTEIKFRNGSYSLYGKDIGFNAKVDKDLEALKKGQNPFLWFDFYNRKAVTYDYRVTVDEVKLRQVLDKSDFLKEDKMSSPGDAKVIVKDNVAFAEDGDKGTVIDEDSLVRGVMESIQKMEHLYTVPDSCYSAPKYNSESPEVKACVDEVNEYLNLDIKYIFGDYVLQLSKEDIYNMITISPDYKVSVKKDVVKSFIDKFAKEHNTYGQEKRRFVTHSGRTAVINGSSYGWEIDSEAETEELYRVVSNKFSVDRIPAFKHKAYTYSSTGDDIGGDYVEVDLGNQHVYVYKDHKVIIETDCVSGNMAQGHGTPSGLYPIRAKQSPTILRGDDYESPVSYWMPFNGGIGLHDANWRGKFGGEIYKTNGSHGCVNLPVSVAGDIYRNVHVGMPVICYWNSDLE